MSLFDTLARWLGLSEPPADPRGEAGPGPASRSVAASTAFAPEPGATLAVEPVGFAAADPHAPMWASFERHLAQFMAHSVVPHRLIEPDDAFRLVRVQVVPQHAEAAAALERFLSEFRPASRRRAVLSAVTRLAGPAIDTRDFVDFERDVDAAALEEVDPYDAQLAPQQQGGFRFTLFGEWVLQPAPAADAVPSPSEAPLRSPAATTLRLRIDDASGRREEQASALPLPVGRRAGDGLLVVAGRFVSRRHGELQRDGHGRFWWQEASVNGSVVDGQPVAAGERHALRRGSRIQLGGAAPDRADCPTIEVDWDAGTIGDEPTPLRQALPAAGADAAVTPLRPAAPAVGSAAVTPIAVAPPTVRAPLALLGLRDAQGSRTVAVSALPFTIGRGDHADLRLPESHAGVSRQHLILDRVDAAGAHFSHPGADKWGSQIDGVEQGEAFVLPWGRQLTLAPRHAGEAAPATLLLLPPGPAT